MTLLLALTLAFAPASNTHLGLYYESLQTETDSRWSPDTLTIPPPAPPPSYRAVVGDDAPFWRIVRDSVWVKPDSCYIESSRPGYYYSGPHFTPGGWKHVARVEFYFGGKFYRVRVEEE